MATSIVLVRHGETDWNVEGRIQGHLQIPLNERGLAQAEAVAARLVTIPFSALYSSDLLRARQTAEAVARDSGKKVVTDKRLREWDLGILSGLMRPVAEELHPEAFGVFRNRIVDQPIPGGESIRARYDRVTGAVQNIADAHPDETVVTVSHGGPLGDCYRRAVGAPLESQLKIDLFNAAINLIRIEGNTWSIESWGTVDHLEEIGTLANWEGRTLR
jgi:probable phosphoglycerate mutase